MQDEVWHSLLCERQSLSDMNTSTTTPRTCRQTVYLLFAVLLCIWPAAARAQATDFWQTSGVGATAATGWAAGIDCECTKTGDYGEGRKGKIESISMGDLVEAKVINVSATEGRSPNGKYRLVVSGNATSGWAMSVIENKSGGQTLVTKHFTGGVDWGFGPDGHGFAYWEVNGNNVTVEVYDLSKRPVQRSVEYFTHYLDASQSQVGILFSPTGSHVLVATKEDAINTRVTLVTAARGDVLSRVSNLNPQWGFSPEENRFAYWTLQGNTLQVQLFDLDTVPAKANSFNVNVYADAAGGNTYLGFSPDGNHLLINSRVGATQSSVNILSIQGDRPVSKTFNGDVGFGFSPDGGRFALWYLGGGETVELYNLRRRPAFVGKETLAISGGSSKVLFSPKGNYLLHAVLSTPTQLFISVLDTTGTRRFSDTVDFYTPPAQVGDKLGQVAWHFGPDAKDRSFVYSWTSGPLTVKWALANLEEGTAPVTKEINPIASFWQFSPCGDVVALVEQGASGTSATLYQTTDGTQAGSRTFNNNNVYVRATSASHEAVVNGVINTLAPNTAAQSCTPPPPLALAKLTVSPDAIEGGNPSEGTVLLNRAVTSGNVTIELQTTSTEISLPERITISAGSASASFQIDTQPVPVRTEAVLSATFGGVTVKDTLVLLPPGLAAFDVTEEIVGGNEIGALVELTGMAPEGGITLTLTSSHPQIVSVPATVAIDEYEYGAWTPMPTAGVDAEVRVTLTASLGGVSKKDSVLVRPASLEAFDVDLAVCEVDFDKTIGGKPIVFRVRLDGLPPASGATVILASSSNAATVPATVFLSAADREATVEVSTQRVQAPTPVRITATYRGTTLTYETTLIPPPYAFTITDLGVPPGGTNSSAVAINNPGQVILTSGSNMYVWQNGTTTPLPVPAGNLAYARDINDAGQIVGSMSQSAKSLPILWEGDSLHVLPVGEGGEGIAYAINDGGQVVGYVTDAQGKMRPSAWIGDSLWLVKTAPGYPMGYASDVNNAGQIVGVAGPYSPVQNMAPYHAFTYDPATDDARSFGVFNLNSFAYAINEAGQIAGWYGGGVIWEGTSLRPIGGELSGINEVGNTVGHACPSCELFGVTYATFADDQHAYNLNCLVADDTDWDLVMAHDLNDLNQIVGYGTIGGETHGFLASPASMVPATDVTVSLTSGPHNVDTGANATFTMVVANPSSVPAAQVKVTGTIQGALVPVSAASSQGTCGITGGTVTCEVGDLAAGQSLTVTINTHASSTGLAHLAVQAATQSVESNAANNTVGVPVTVHGVPAGQAVANVPSGTTGSIDLEPAGLRIAFTDASETNGSLTARRYDTTSPQNDRLLAITVQAQDGPVTPNIVSGNRYWTVEATGLSGFVYTICLDATDLPGVVAPGQLVVVKREQSEADWVPQNTTLQQEEGRTYLCVAELNSFSQFGIASSAGSNPLPVELVAFEAVTDGTQAVLRWTTASETNNAGFEVQMRVSAADAADALWEQVGFVEGRGNTARAQQYEHRVERLAAGRHVFRLKQVDYDGTFAYSPEVEVTVELPERYEMGTPHPNPFNPQTQFTLTLAREEHVNIAVFDLLGRQVALLHDGMLSANEAHRFRFEASTLPSGLYFIRAVGASFQASRSITLLK